MTPSPVDKKENCETTINKEKDYKVFLLDIEGTTTPITFVTETLFPFAKENVRNHLEENWTEKETIEDVKELKKQAERDIRNELPDVPEIKDGTKDEEINCIVKNVHWQIKQDRKITALKQLQGHIWRHGYDSNKLKSVVYHDVNEVLKELCSSGKKLYIYSSGSVEAQKLLFKYSNFGDLTPLLSGYYDTKIGAKRESQSYKNITEDIGCKPCEMLFLTDVIEEAKAAKEAGVTTCIVLRKGNKEIPKTDLNNFLTITSFADLLDEDEPPPKKAK